MHHSQSELVRRIADASSAFQEQRTGRAPESVAVVLAVDTLVITLYGALSPAERDLAKTAEGAAQVQEFHRLLFAASAGVFRLAIEEITGLKVMEAVAEVEPAVGAVVHAFTNGTMVQVFHFAHPLNAPQLDPEIVFSN